MWLKLQSVPVGRFGRIVEPTTPRRAYSEEPGKLRSRLVLATLLVAACAACSDEGASPAPTEDPSSTTSAPTAPTSSVPPDLAGYSEQERAAYETAVTEYDAFTRRNDHFYAGGQTTVAAKRFYQRYAVDWSTAWGNLAQIANNNVTVTGSTKALAFGQDGTSHWATQRLGYQLTVSQDNVAYDDTIQLYTRSGMSLTTTPFSGAPNFLPEINGRPTVDDPRMKGLLSPWNYALAQQEFAQPPLTMAQLSGLQGFGKAAAKIAKSGGTTLVGTDNPIGFGNFGQVIAISAMTHIGMNNYQALRGATVEPAKLMGVLDQIGTIQPGMIADMDIIHGNPLEDIETIANDDYVMQNGNLYTPQQLIGPYAANNAAKQAPAKQAPAKQAPAKQAPAQRTPVWQTPAGMRMRTSFDYIMEYMC
jgi:hypothetical protein